MAIKDKVESDWGYAFGIPVVGLYRSCIGRFVGWLVLFLK